MHTFLDGSLSECSRGREEPTVARVPYLHLQEQLASASLLQSFYAIFKSAHLANRVSKPTTTPLALLTPPAIRQKRWRHLRYCCKAAKLSVEMLPLLTGTLIDQIRRHNPFAVLPPFVARRKHWRRLRHCCKCTSTAATARGQTLAAGLPRPSSERVRRLCGCATTSTRCTRQTLCARSATARCVHRVHGVHTCVSSSFNVFPFSPSFMTPQAQQTTHFN